MSAVRQKHTAPEIKLRRALYAAGLRGWRCHYKRVTGCPDLAWPRRKLAVFVDGAFWHGHPSRHRPGRSGSYWDEKIQRNVERDRSVEATLKAQGWTALRFWDFEVDKQIEECVNAIAAILAVRNDDVVRGAT